MLPVIKYTFILIDNLNQSVCSTRCHDRNILQCILIVRALLPLLSDCDYIHLKIILLTSPVSHSTGGNNFACFILYLVSSPWRLYEFGFDKRHVSLGVVLEVLFPSYVSTGVFVCETTDIILSSFSALTSSYHISLGSSRPWRLFSLHIISYYFQLKGHKLM